MKNKGLLKLLLGFVGDLADLRSEYTKIKQNPEETSQSTKMGKTSIKNTIIAVLCYALMFGLVFAGIKLLPTAFIILGIIFLVAGIVGLLVPIGRFILGLSASIKQLKLNKKSIGWVSLVLWLVSLLALVILSIWILATFC